MTSETAPIGDGRTVLVAGATGDQGGTIARHLLADAASAGAAFPVFVGWRTRFLQNGALPVPWRHDPVMRLIAIDDIGRSPRWRSPGPTSARPQ